MWAATSPTFQNKMDDFNPVEGIILQTADASVLLVVSGDELMVSEKAVHQSPTQHRTLRLGR